MFKKLIFSLLGIALTLSPTLSSAEGLEEYGQYGACFTGPDPVFHNALTGYAAPGITTNARPHWHFDWMVAKGVPLPRVGECAVMTLQKIVDEHGEHHFVYDFYITDQDSAMEASGNGNGPYIRRERDCANLGAKCDEKDRL